MQNVDGHAVAAGSPQGWLAPAVIYEANWK